MIPEYINNKRTKELFGYGWEDISDRSGKKVIKVCSNCKKEVCSKKYSIFDQKNPELCFNCSPTLRNIRNKPNTIEKPDCVDNELTFKQFGYRWEDIPTNSEYKVIRVCSLCNNKEEIRKIDVIVTKTNFCRSCIITKNNRDKSQDKLKPDFVNNEKTKDVFGYYWEDLADSSIKKVITVCSNCGKERQSIKRNVNRAKVSVCTDCYRKSSKDYQLGEKNNRFGKPPVPVPLVKVMHNGNEITMRSKWEKLFAENLTKCGTRFEYEPNTFSVEYEFEGRTITSSYTPDFLIIDEDMYVEIKGFWRRKTDKIKYEAFKKQYPFIHIQLIQKQEMKQLGLI